MSEFEVDESKQPSKEPPAAEPALSEREGAPAAAAAAAAAAGRVDAARESGKNEEDGDIGVGGGEEGGTLAEGPGTVSVPEGGGEHNHRCEHGGSAHSGSEAGKDHDHDHDHDHGCSQEGHDHDHEVGALSGCSRFSLVAGVGNFGGLALALSPSLLPPLQIEV